MTVPIWLRRWIGIMLLEVCERLPLTKRFLKRWGRRTSQEWFRQRVVRVQLPNGGDLKLSSFRQNYLSFELFWRGINYYEPITTAVATELASSSATFVDVGANIGFYSLVMAARHPKLKVIAFEPNPKNFRMLESNVRLNRFSNVTCEKTALSDADGTATLYLSPSDMSASLESEFETSRRGEVEVQREMLDTYALERSLRAPLLIKVDVEGHESAFIQGASETISRLKPDIIMEVTASGDEFATSLLLDAGYKFYAISDEGLIPQPELKITVRGRFLFLNYLLSVRPEAEVKSLFRRIEPQVRAINLKETSKYVSVEMIRHLREREAAIRSSGSLPTSARLGEPAWRPSAGLVKRLPI